MSHREHFAFLPKNQLFFLDASVFGLSRSKYASPGYDREGWNNSSIRGLLEEAARLHVLNLKLQDTNNWETTSEVREELVEGNSVLMGWIEKETRERGFKRVPQRRISRRHEKEVALCGVLRQRQETLGLLSREEQQTETYLNPGLIHITNSIMPYIKESFRRNRGNPNELNTDCKLIALALANDASIWSYDRTLLKTFRHCLKTLPRERANFGFSNLQFPNAEGIEGSYNPVSQ